jgi:hypothetical protein
MPLLEENQLQVTDLAPRVGDESEKKQRRQMLIALALLLAALILVLIKDRDFWFPPEPPAQSEAEPVEEPSPDVKTPSATATTDCSARAPEGEATHAASGCSRYRAESRARIGAGCDEPHRSASARSRGGRR